MKIHFTILISLLFLLASDITHAQSSDWDDGFVGGCNVIYDSTNSIFRMWYTGGQGDLLGQIGYATSTDGITWQKYENNPVLEEGPENSWDHHAVGYPTVVIVNDTCRMWYVGVSDEIAIQIGYATSVDGINWTKYENNPVIQLGNAGSWEDTWVYMPSVIYHESAFHMWYCGATGDVSDYIPWKEEIGYASSSDGKSWTKHASNPVLEVNTPGSWDDSYVGGPTVLFHDAIFHMWYYGWGPTSGNVYQIGYATSADGISWDRSDLNPVLTPSGWEHPRNQDPCVIIMDGTYHMWYSGKYVFQWEIGYATSADGIDWTKDPSNPVVRKGSVDIIDEKKTDIPSNFILSQNYPNPFNPKTVIRYALPVTCHLDLSIYNIHGQKIATVVNKKQPAGSYRVQWDASGFASGIYIYQLKVQGQKQNALFTRKLILLK
jgi:predicted GH43/DUF377 family glycosyl hydrolase